MAEETLRRLASERAVLEDQKDELLRQVEEIDRRLRENAIEAAEFAPINIIPDDVLKLILEEAYVHRISRDSYPSYSCQMKSPLLPTHVTQRWRRVSISLPKLWTCIHTNLPPDALALFIERSRNLPSQLVHKAYKQSFISVTEFIRINAWRWTSIQAEVISPLCSRDFGHIIDGIQFPLLERITFYGTSEPMVLLPMVTSPIIPNLKYLALVHTSLRWESPYLQNLRTLYIEVTSVAGAYLADLSRTCPNVVELTITGTPVTRYRGRGPTSVASFLRLERIHFDYMDWESTLLYINAPRLQTLTGKRCSIMVDPAHAIHTSTNTYPILTHIRLESCATEDEEAALGGTFSLFRRAPNLTTLELIKCTAIPEFFAWLRDTMPASGDGPVLVPKLASVTMTDVKPRHFAAVEEFVRRRSTHRPPLRELHLEARTVEAMGAELMQKLGQLVEVSTLPDPPPRRPFNAVN